MNSDPSLPELNENEWYVFTLHCGHQCASKVRLKYQRIGQEYHRVRCPKCDRIKKDDPFHDKIPSAWQLIEEVTSVSDVPSRTPPILPNRILRLDKSGGGGTLAYTTIDRDY